jgi:putative CocE/NonD family hydrolase
MNRWSIAALLLVASAAWAQPAPAPPAATPQTAPAPAPTVPLPAPPAPAPPAAAPSPPAGDAEQEVTLRWGVKVPLRDGIRLNATLYMPKQAPGPLPVIFLLTPYLADSAHERGMYFARHGYNYALVDVRGRGNSEGEFEAFANEGRDGHDVVEWLARQPWCDGKVAMWGGSYAGFDQWATAKEMPPHLATIVPAASAHPGVDFPFFHNIFYAYDVQWRTFTSGSAPNAKLFGDSAFWGAKFRRLYHEHLAFDRLDEIAGNPSADFQKWIANPVPGPYWEAMNPSPEQLRALALPILTITGHYDGDQPGALDFYRQHMQHGSAAARDRHYLVIGPWDHPGTRTPRRDVGGLHSQEAGELDLNKLHREWYDWTMKGGPRPEFLKQRVAYYVTGGAHETWKYADSLEAIAGETRQLFLHSAGGQANDVFRSGALAAEKPAGEEPDHYVYDPLDVRPAELEKGENPDYLTDQRVAHNLAGGGVIYHSAPFSADTEVSGMPRLHVWIAMDVPDTDFAVALYEIKPDGGSVLLGEDLRRARHRESLTRETPVRPGEINRYDFELRFSSRVVAKGSRLRLVLAALNSTYYEKNYNSGGAVARESGKDARTAHVAVYHDAHHASVLELPVAR